MVGQYRNTADQVVVEGPCESELYLHGASVESSARGYVDDRWLD